MLNRERGTGKFEGPELPMHRACTARWAKQLQNICTSRSAQLIQFYVLYYFLSYNFFLFCFSTICEVMHMGNKMGCA